MLCPVCRRHIPVRRDGRLQAHLAVFGRREKCEGSGRLSAHLQLAMQEMKAGQCDTPPERSSWGQLSKAARFNAPEEWDKADTLWLEYEAMYQIGAASAKAIHAAYEAYSRAWDDAKALAPIALMAPDDCGGESA